jgi:membrane associated rhomboid family serine protease
LLNSDSIYQTLIFSPQKTNEVSTHIIGTLTNKETITLFYVQVWRFLTYTFLHAGTVHLTLNIIIQIMVAFPLETEQGHLQVLLVYLFGILSGSLGASVFEPTLMIGASAGVYSLLMSHIPHIVMVSWPPFSPKSAPI